MSSATRVGNDVRYVPRSLSARSWRCGRLSIAVSLAARCIAIKSKFLLCPAVGNRSGRISRPRLGPCIASRRTWICVLGFRHGIADVTYSGFAATWCDRTCVRHGLRMGRWRLEIWRSFSAPNRVVCFVVTDSGASRRHYLSVRLQCFVNNCLDCVRPLFSVDRFVASDLINCLLRCVRDIGDVNFCVRDGCERHSVKLRRFEDAVAHNLHGTNTANYCCLSSSAGRPEPSPSVEHLGLRVVPGVDLGVDRASDRRQVCGASHVCIFVRLWPGFRRCCHTAPITIGGPRNGHL